MWEKLKKIEKNYKELEAHLAKPDIVADQKRFRQIVQQHAELSAIVENLHQYKKNEQEIIEAKEMIASGGEVAELAKEELQDLNQRKTRIENELKLLLIPKDPYDSKNVFVEIRAGTGGEEAALFTADLFRMYSRYAEQRKWKLSIIDQNATSLSGFKEIVFQVVGMDVYKDLKYEAGVHRVQRVPTTEASGRIHTSAVTVAVLPEVDELEVKINPSEIRVDIFCSSGPGGQSVNTTYSAVRLTHLPSGIVVQCQDERSQLKNKNKAMKVLLARLQKLKEEEKSKELAADRKQQVGSGDRSEKIRTYNYPQNRVTDHRIGISLYNLEAFMNGEISEIIKQLQEFQHAEKLSQL